MEAVLSFLTPQTPTQQPNTVVQANSGAVGGEPVPDSDTTTATAPKIPLPEKYDGKSDECRGFLNHCRLHFKNQPSVLALSEAKVIFMISLLRGRALAWVSPFLTTLSLLKRL